MSVYKEMKLAETDEEYRQLLEYARWEARVEDDETWDEPDEEEDDEDEPYEDEFVWDIPDFCETNEPD